MVGHNAADLWKEGRALLQETFAHDNLHQTIDIAKQWVMNEPIYDSQQNSQKHTYDMIFAYTNIWLLSTI